ncbi:hypothetical protein LEP1GSC173_0901 [Leptospira interrogans str. HAI1594]|uniref:Uncharacterized protein n=1 Tax=Leptospira interrogans str. FPW1039 TaxID=1193040 RepID=A0A0F6IF87_LEPIR|nr:hypothetical protein LEP1GSC045_0560 [Leptospira interrogans serovar Pomona str. Kennewicki LC82-25]EKN96000.1 hypothetical protein LEP1GSC014_4305 [Leptospira interrogans serovar Pomona str. Pomona]EKO89317.1 hypothetical protein LEP1GSC009_4056 [Leptospira interrogans serovar Grippotyphosa str. Andaman]EKP21946.1 hypothetical protein LEP1GSC117_4316 [Leptospira interrogans serovar Icterohaemorrhagiae str. Verdun LP]EKP76348.1 hypothetical protein LEP1GSC173_0901 [Leptospira interrogans str
MGFHFYNNRKTVILCRNLISSLSQKLKEILRVILWKFLIKCSSSYKLSRI